MCVQLYLTYATGARFPLNCLNDNTKSKWKTCKSGIARPFPFILYIEQISVSLLNSCCAINLESGSDVTRRTKFRLKICAWEMEFHTANNDSHNNKMKQSNMHINIYLMATTNWKYASDAWKSTSACCAKHFMQTSAVSSKPIRS